MKQRMKWAALALSLMCAASAAMAGVAKGGKLFIKGAGVNMWDKADASGKKTAIKQGEEVTWNGASEKDKSMHEIAYKGKKGFVHMSALTPNRPADEVQSDGKTMSAQAFASSGAATKAMSEAGLKYASGAGPTGPEVAAGLIHMEGTSEEQKKNVADHVKKSGLGGEK